MEIEPLRFIIHPFRCPNCNHALLVDAMKQERHGAEVNVHFHNVFDWNNGQDEDEPGEFRVMGRWQLISEIKRLRSQKLKRWLSRGW